MTGAPWFQADVNDWRTVRGELIALGVVWPDGLIRLDLRWWADQSRVNRARRPSSRTPARQWGVTHWHARKMLTSGWEAPELRAHAPHTRRTPAAQEPHTGRTLDPDGQALLGSDPHTGRTPAAQAPHTIRPTRSRTEHRAQSTDPDPPVTPAPPEPRERTRWEAAGVDLGSGVNPAHVTADVWDVWEHWRDLRRSTGTGNPRSLQRADVRAIRGGLRVKASEIEGVPEGVSIKRVMIGILDYALTAPAGMPRVDHWRSGGYLKPQNLVRADKIATNAEIVLRSGWRRSGKFAAAGGRGPADCSTTVEPGPDVAALWDAWCDPFDCKRRTVALGIPLERWRDYVRAVGAVGSAGEIGSMHAIDRKAARASFSKRAADWLATETER